MNDILSHNIRRVRRLKGVTQKQLADFLGCSEAQISHIENGNRNIDFDDLQRIATFFKVAYESFFVQTTPFVNFRHDQGASDVTIREDIIRDFKEFARKQLDDRNKK